MFSVLVEHFRVVFHHIIIPRLTNLRSLQIKLLTSRPYEAGSLAIYREIDTTIKAGIKITKTSLVFAP